jgi:uncharacterized protein with von Willebrand factor type A (vWA) domain
MEATLHRFVRLLRRWGVRVSVAEATDAMHCARQPGVLADRELLRCALRTALLKDQRDTAVFEDLFDAFFALVRVGGATHAIESGPGRAGSVDEISSYAGDLDTFTLSGEPSEAKVNQDARAENVRHLFDLDNLASSFNLSQDDGMIDLSAPTDEIAFSQGNQIVGSEGYRIQLEAPRMHAGGAPGQLTSTPGAMVEVGLGLEEQQALLDWLGNPDDPDAAAAFREARILGDLPAALQRHAEALLALEGRGGQPDRRRVAAVGELDAADRAELEDALRRIARSLRGARTHRRTVAPRGRVDAARTMRRSLRYDGVPFAPVTRQRPQDRPRLVVLADVSLSVRASAHFTLNLVHSLQDLVAQVRSFAFVADLVETTTLLAEHHAEAALGVLFGGDLLDLNANSDYGSVFGEFLAEHAGALCRRTTLLILGDGRGNGNDPGLSEFAEITRRVRETIWLTPEPRYSWRLGSCDLPAYADYCSRVRVVRGLGELSRTARDLSTEAAGR